MWFQGGCRSLWCLLWLCPLYWIIRCFRYVRIYLCVYVMYYVVKYINLWIKIMENVYEVVTQGTLYGFDQLYSQTVQCILQHIAAVMIVYNGWVSLTQCQNYNYSALKIGEACYIQYNYHYAVIISTLAIMLLPQYYVHLTSVACRLWIVLSIYQLGSYVPQIIIIFF